MPRWLWGHSRSWSLGVAAAAALWWLGAQNPEPLLDNNAWTPRVVHSAEGGWPPPPPWAVGDHVWCKDDEEGRLLGGVDLLRPIFECTVTQQRNSAAPTLQVRCGAGAEEENVPTELCEPQPYAGDASVFDAGGGLHYTTFRSTATMHVAMRKLASLRGVMGPSQGAAQTLICYYFHGAHRTVPLRAEKSGQYTRVYRTLIQSPIPVSNKLTMARTVAALGDPLTNAFPPTFETYSDALTAVGDPNAAFFVKRPVVEGGGGLEVLSRSQLEARAQAQVSPNVSLTKSGKPVLIQRALSDLALIDRRRFDIRFYILVHRGRVYMHRNALVKTCRHGKPFDSTSLDLRNWIPKHGVACPLSYAFTCRQVPAPWDPTKNYQSSPLEKWLAAVYKTLAIVLPVLQNVAAETAKDHFRYHIFGADAVITNDGRAVLIEFNDWPSLVLSGELKTLTFDGDGSAKMRPLKDTDPNFEDVALESSGGMIADFLALVLGHPSVTEPTSVGGRLREVIPT